MQIGLRTIVAFILVIVLSSFRENKNLSFLNRVPENLVVSVPLYSANQIIPVTNVIGVPFTGQSYVGFKEALAFKESSGSYTSVNTLGYMGKYQFGKSTLAFFGQNNTDCFMFDPALQERIFYHNTARNKWILRRDIKRYVGVKMKGILISESGILAAAHLAGAGNVKKYLRSWGEQKFEDAYQTSIEEYLIRFSGFDLSDVQSRKRVLFM